MVSNNFFTIQRELFSYGKLPYNGLTKQEIISKVREGYRLEAPEHCPSQVYSIMKECWNADSSHRPSFEELEQKFNIVIRQYNQQSTIMAPILPFTSDIEYN